MKVKKPKPPPKIWTERLFTGRNEPVILNYTAEPSIEFFELLKEYCDFRIRTIQRGKKP